MAQHDDFVAALARAYSLSELFPVEDRRIRDKLQAVVDGLDGALVLRVDGEALRAGGERLADQDGAMRELARDLELAGVAEVRVPGDVELENLMAFVRWVREGSGDGDGVRTARGLARDLPQIGVAFGARAPARSGSGRSVAAVFGGKASTSRIPERADPDREPQAPGEVARPGPEIDAGEDAALQGAVEGYLEAPLDGRRELEDEIRRAASTAEERGEIGEVAEAVERLAVDGTSGSGDPGAVGLAKQLLTPAVATRLALHLGSLRDEERRDALIRASGELGGEMAAALAEALADTGDRAARRTCIEAMVALGDEAREQAEGMLDDSRWFVVRNGVRILGGIGSEDDVEHLTSPLAHDDPRVRRETVMALGRIGGEDAGMLILGMLDDPEPDVRAGVATALGALGVERAVKVLLERLEKEESEKVQVQVLRALGALGDPGAVPAIEKRVVATFFSRPPRPLRIAGYRALASIGTPHAMELLEDARDDRDDEVRSAVRSLLHAREG